jgi:hypothetical protein
VIGYGITATGIDYIEAQDADGTAWGVPQVLGGGGAFNQQNPCMTVIGGGLPGICFYDYAASSLKFMHQG